MANQFTGQRVNDVEYLMGVQHPRDSLSSCAPLHTQRLRPG